MKVSGEQRDAEMTAFLEVITAFLVVALSVRLHEHRAVLTALELVRRYVIMVSEEETLQRAEAEKNHTL